MARLPKGSGSSIRRVVVVIAAVALLGGCAKMRSQLGLGKQSPDEFSVVTRAPLSVPPDFSLRPPAPGEKRPQEKTAQALAQTALYGAAEDTAKVASDTPGERALLSHADANKAQPGIRRTLNEENAILAADDQSFVDRLMFWQDKEPLGQILDPQKEAQRVQEAIALGKSPTEGETAVIKRRKKAILEGIF